MDAGEKNSGIKCSLCGAVFKSAENTCGGCALKKDCRIICCPNCGFRIPEESNLVSWLKGDRKKQGR